MGSARVRGCSTATLLANARWTPLRESSACCEAFATRANKWHPLCPSPGATFERARAKPPFGSIDPPCSRRTSTWTTRKTRARRIRVGWAAHRVARAPHSREISSRAGQASQASQASQVSRAAPVSRDSQVSRDNPVRAAGFATTRPLVKAPVAAARRVAECAPRRARTSWKATRAARARAARADAVARRARRAARARAAAPVARAAMAERAAPRARAARARAARARAAVSGPAARAARVAPAAAAPRAEVPSTLAHEGRPAGAPFFAPRLQLAHVPRLLPLL